MTAAHSFKGTGEAASLLAIGFITFVLTVGMPLVTAIVASILFDRLSDRAGSALWIGGQIVLAAAVAFIAFRRLARRRFYALISGLALGILGIFGFAAMLGGM